MNVTTNMPNAPGLAAMKLRSAHYADQADAAPKPKPDGLPKPGDTVQLSEEGKAKAGKIKGKLPELDDGGSSGSILKKRIEQLKKEIKEIKESDMPMKEKSKLLQEKESELAELVQQQEKGRTAEQVKQSLNFDAMGTSAKGFAASLG